MKPEDFNFLFGAWAVLAMIVALVIGLAIAAFICWLLVGNYRRIPEPFRVMDPAKVWFLLIPCAPLIWNFWVFPGLSRSFKAYFDSVNDTTVGDCNEKIGLWYSIACATSVIPCVGYITGVAALVLLIVYLIKANELKNRIPVT